MLQHVLTLDNFGKPYTGQNYWESDPDKYRHLKECELQYLKDCECYNDIISVINEFIGQSLTPTVLYALENEIETIISLFLEMHNNLFPLCVGFIVQGRTLTCILGVKKSEEVNNE